jgi:peptidoglycan/xylan/chitin deacetylase (PgdA/CDA1 family)
VTAIDRVKTGVKTVVATAPVWRFARRTRQPGCVVLVYHRVGSQDDPFPHLDVHNFAAQIDWLTRNCRVIAPEQLRSSADHDTGSGRPDVLITFDDGYRSYSETVYPILRKHRIRALNFLCTRYVDDPTLIGWWDKLFLAVGATRRTHVELPWARDPFVLDVAGRIELLQAAKDHIKQRPDDDSESITRTILDALDVDDAGLCPSRQTMTWDEVRAASEFTCFGGHTHNHTIMAQLEPPALETEIRTCRDRLAAETGTVPETFAYPNGRSMDFGQDAKDLLRRHGFRTAFSAIPGVNDIHTDWMEVRRIPGGGSIADLAWRISLLWR